MRDRLRRSGGLPQQQSISGVRRRKDVDSEIAFVLVMVVGLTLLSLLLMGPGMWSEKWGWRTLGRLEHGWNRLFRRNSR